MSHGNLQGLAAEATVCAHCGYGRHEDVTVSGDFTLLPKTAVGALEQTLRGLTLEPALITPRLTEALQNLNPNRPA